jgi:hypothetical protein
MAFKKKARRKVIINNLSNDVHESNISPLVINNAVLVDKSGYKCFFKRLIYIGCPKLKNYGENDFVDGIDLIDANREHFVREMYTLINNLVISNQPIRRIFEGLLKYVQHCDSNSGLEILSQESFLDYSLSIRNKFASGDISLGAARVERGNLYALYKEIYDTQRLYALRKEVGNFKSREGDESKGHKTLSDGEVSKIGKKMLYAYKELAKHLIEGSTPKIYPLFNEDEFIKIGWSTEEVRDIEKSFIKMVTTGNWVNGLSKLALMILSMWTGGNLTVLSRLKKSDISFNKLNGDHYSLKSIKSRAGYKEVILSIGFTKRTKEFIENWIFLSNKINQDIDAPLFPVYKRNGELDEFGLKYPQRQFNVVLDYFKLPNINTSVFRKTRSNIMYRAYEDIFLVADANKSNPETVSKAYLHGVSEVNQMAVTGALEAKMLLVKGTDKATAIEQATYRIKDPLTEKEWQEKKRKTLSITMSGLRCSSPKGEIAKKSLRPYRGMTETNSGFCVDFLSCFSCEYHALIAEVDDIWLILSFKDTVIESLDRPSFNSAPTEKFNNVLTAVNYALSRLEEKAPDNFKLAVLKNNNSPHPLYNEDSSIDDLIEVYQ